MKVSEALLIIQRALAAPPDLWPGYSPRDTPLILFDDDDFACLNHPAPPAERPAELTAGTSVQINGVETATVPLGMWPDESDFVPMSYHECFHVHQNLGAFAGGEPFDFFKVLAFYPELDPAYRALCAAEAQVLNSNASTEEKAALLSALARRRQSILGRGEGLLAFENMIERNEGTAAFVEQQARQALYGIAPGPTPCVYGYARQYTLGPSLCRLLVTLPVPGWQARVEKGQSLSGILLERFPVDADLSSFDLEEKTRQEESAVRQVRDEITQRIILASRAGATNILFPPGMQTYRSFSPASLRALGDGRLVHTEFVTVQCAAGVVDVKGLCVEDHTTGELTLFGPPPTLEGDTLHLESPQVKVSLSKVEGWKGYLSVAGRVTEMNTGARRAPFFIL